MFAHLHIWDHIIGKQNLTGFMGGASVGRPRGYVYSSIARQKGICCVFVYDNYEQKTRHRGRGV